MPKAAAPPQPRARPCAAGGGPSVSVSSQLAFQCWLPELRKGWERGLPRGAAGRAPAAADGGIAWGVGWGRLPRASGGPGTKCGGAGAGRRALQGRQACLGPQGRTGEDGRMQIRDQGIFGRRCAGRWGTVETIRWVRAWQASGQLGRANAAPGMRPWRSGKRPRRAGLSRPCGGPAATPAPVAAPASKQHSRPRAWGCRPAVAPARWAWRAGSRGTQLGCGGCAASAVSAGRRRRCRCKRPVVLERG
jgi:hypothetical protein